MATEDCLIKVKAYTKELGLKVSDEYLDKAFSDLSDLKKNSLSKQEFKEKAKASIDQEKNLVSAKRANDIINKEHIVNFVSDLKESLSNVPDKKKVKVFEQLMDANSPRPKSGGNLSAPAIRDQIKSKYYEMLTSLLGKDIDLSEANILRKEITQDMASIQDGGKTAPSGNELARKFADAYIKVQKALFKLKSAHDPLLEEISDYFVRQSHNREKILAIGSDAWIDKILSLAGKKTMPGLGLAEKRAALLDIYNEIVSGTYTSSSYGQGRDIQIKMAQKRTIRFNDWESFHEYNEELGSRNLHETMLSTINSSAQNIATMIKYGNNPDRLLNESLNFMKKTYPNLVPEIRGKEARIRSKFQANTFVPQSPAWSWQAKVADGALAWQAATKLGQTVPNSVLDVISALRVIKDSSGLTYTQAAQHLVADFVKKMAPFGGAGRDQMANLALHQHVLERGMFSELSTENKNKIGRGMSWLLRLQSKLATINRYMDSASSATAAVMSKVFGDNSHLSYKSLPPEVSNSILRYGAKEPEWNVIRQGIELDPSLLEGMPGTKGKYITMNGLASLPDEVFSKYLVESGKLKEGETASGAAIIRARAKIDAIVGGAYNDFANIATSTAGEAEKYFLNMGIDRNSSWGALVRLMTQFKSSAVKNLNSIERSAYSNPQKPEGDWKKAISYMVALMGIYTIKEEVKNAYNGKTPEDPTSPKFITKAVTNSGAGGIWGDMIATDFINADNPYDLATGAIKSLAGPTVGSAAEAGAGLFFLAKSAVDEETNPPLSMLAKTITDNIPLHNIYWLQKLAKFYLLDGLREQMQPGYLMKQEARVEETPGLFEEKQRFFALPPTESWWQ